MQKSVAILVALLGLVSQFATIQGYHVTKGQIINYRAMNAAKNIEERREKYGLKVPRST